MHANAASLNGDFRDLRDVAAERRVDGNPAIVSLRERRSPASFLRREIEHAEVARLVGEESPAELHRVLLRRRRELVDEALGDEGVLRVANRTPEANGNSEVLKDEFDVDVRNGV